MPNLLPVNIGEAIVVSRAAGQPGVDVVAPTPPSVDQLTDWSTENYQLTEKAAATLGFPVFRADSSIARTVVIYGESRYCDVDSGDGHVYRFGVSLRVLISVTTENLKGNLALPVIAANVQLDRATASAQLIVRGYKGSSLAALLPAPQSFSVDSYSQYLTAIAKIQEVITGDHDNISPELLATTVATPELPSPAASVGTVIALLAISNGHTLSATKQTRLADISKDAALRHNDEESIVTAIEHQYAVMELSDDEVPSEIVMLTAKEQLGTLAPVHHFFHRH